MVIRDETVAKSFAEQFDRMWNDTKGFQPLSLKIAQATPTTTAKPAAQPKVQAQPATTATKSATAETNVYYKSFKEVRAAGKAPLHKGDPGYRAGLDRDNDGIACE